MIFGVGWQGFFQANAGGRQCRIIPISQIVGDGSTRGGSDAPIGFLQGEIRAIGGGFIGILQDQGKKNEVG